jgi:hypothetical protein
MAVAIAAALVVSASRMVTIGTVLRRRPPARQSPRNCMYVGVLPMTVSPSVGAAAQLRLRPRNARASIRFKNKRRPARSALRGRLAAFGPVGAARGRWAIGPCGSVGSLSCTQTLFQSLAPLSAPRRWCFSAERRQPDGCGAWRKAENHKAPTGAASVQLRPPPRRQTALRRTMA